MSSEEKGKGIKRKQGLGKGGKEGQKTSGTISSDAKVKAA